MNSNQANIEQVFAHLVEINKEKNEKNIENATLGGIKTIGALIASSSNEHPLIRLSGVALVLSNNKGPISIRKYSFLTCMVGCVLAKDKKKAFIQRSMSVGSVIMTAGVAIFLTNK